MERGFYSGRLNEIDYCGEINTNDPAFQKALEEVKKTPRPDSKFPYYVNFSDSLNLVKKFQPIDKNTGERIDPTNPAKPFLKDLRLELVDTLDLSEEEADKVKAYTAVKSPLDIFHGVDAFLDIKGDIVTLDLTLRKDTSSKTKADIIVEELPNPDDPDQEDDYLKAVERKAEEISRVLAHK